LNAREPKVGLANTANIRQFHVAVETFSGHMRSGTSGCKMLVPDMQNQDQRPIATAVLQRTRTEEFIEWKKKSHDTIPVVLLPARCNTPKPKPQVAGCSSLCDNRIKYCTRMVASDA